MAWVKEATRWLGWAACAGVVACGSPEPAPVVRTVTNGGGGSGGSGGSGGASGLITPSLGGSITIDLPANRVDPGAACDPTRGVSAIEPTLLVRDPELLNEFPLEKVLAQVIRSSGASVSPTELLQRLFDHDNTKESGVFADAPHCDDGLPAPTDCGRAEGRLARSEGLFVPGHADYFEPVALVNRFDLTPNNETSCGEYRIVYAKRSGRADATNRLFISVEAALFNETRNLAACRPVAELWAALPSRGVEQQRADLVQLFFQGVGGLAPVLTAAQLGAEGAGCGYVGRCGQLRIARGMQEPLAFLQFRAVIESGLERATTLRFEATPLTRALRPDVFDLSNEDALHSGLRNSFKFSTGPLANPNVNRIDLSLSTSGEAKESAISGANSPNYAARLSAASAAEQAAFAASLAPDLDAANAACPPEDPITPLALVSRAAAVGCAGCHAPNGFLPEGRKLGCGTVWPESLGATHVDEQGQISPALHDVFLPYRASVLTTFLQACDLDAIEKNLHPSPEIIEGFPECFPAGTAITLAGGQTKAIEQIEPGEWVQSFDEATQTLVSAPVERLVIRHDADRFVRIDDELLATDNHPFFQDGRWVRAIDLEPGKSLLSLAGTSTLRAVRIETLLLETGPRVTYNVRVAGTNSYFAGGKLVHDRP